jgi:hypothetical protein
LFDQILRLLYCIKSKGDFMMKRILICCFFLFSFSSNFYLVHAGFFSNLIRKKEFSSLSDLKRHAKFLPELPPIDNKDYIRPDYSTFYNSLTPNFFSRSWNKVKYLWPKKKYVRWSPKVLKRLLDSVSNDRETSLKKGFFVTKFTPLPNSNFVLWSNLFGSFHSFVRSLEKLNKQGIIDNNLKIKRERHYLVFNGNCINFSPFGMETLTAVLLLMKRNSGQVFYVKGLHETKKYWDEHGFKKELQGKISQTKDFAAFESSIERFFNTLPAALFIRRKTGLKSQFVEISSSDFAQSIYGQEGFRSFLHAPDYGKAQIFKELSTLRSFVSTSTFADSFSIDAYVKSDNSFNLLEKSDGLWKEKSLSRSPVWKTFSAQNRTHRVTKQFYKDSFIILSLPKIFSGATISSYSRDSRKKDDYKVVTHKIFA